MEVEALVFLPGGFQVCSAMNRSHAGLGKAAKGKSQEREQE
jgi:hypothetical protein